jgi:hypothetical protein
MRLVNDKGALSGYAVIILLALGGGLIFGSLAWVENYYLRVLGFSIGIASISGGGYGARAGTLGLRSFGQEPWRRARSTYSNDSEFHNKNEK